MEITLKCKCFLPSHWGTTLTLLSFTISYFLFIYRMFFVVFFSLETTFCLYNLSSFINGDKKVNLTVGFYLEMYVNVNVL